MNPSIAIIELYQHDEVLRHYCEMLEGSDCNIKIFCSKVVYDCMEDFWEVENFDWEVQKKGKSIGRFLKRNKLAFESFDLLFITTMLNNFRAFYKIIKANKTLLLIHNVHSFLAPDRNMMFEKPFWDWLRFMKISFFRMHFYKKKIVEHSSTLAFPTKQILEYAKANFDLPDHLTLMSLPFSYAKKKKEIVKDDWITITIPGTVNTELRNYEIVLKAILELERKLEYKIRLVFLGRFKRIKMPDFGLIKEKLELITFNDFIAIEEYERWLLKTDFLILPYKEFGRNHVYREHLGYSKISGSINDMIRYQIPALIPSHYPLEDSLSLISDSYGIHELTDKIESWLTHKTYLEKNRYRDDFSRTFNIEKRRDSFLQKIKSII